MSCSFWRMMAGLFAALVFSSAAGAAEPAIIAKARAHLGSEGALDGVKTVHFLGTLATLDPADPQKEVRAKMEIIFQKPDQQRIVATTEKSTEVTALDGYDAWQRLTDGADPTKWRQTLLGGDQIKRLRANTWENLSFYRGLERRGGQIEDQGDANVEGVACRKIAFIHSPTIVFYRFFEAATGRLVHTMTESGGTIREQGEIVVKGIRFPKSIVTETKTAAGKMQTVTIHFEKVMVNETLPSSLFALPPLSAR